ncbi:transporter [Halalkalibacter wakoensis JCM 9140]|uniref:Transporter n=1 Tax=Halalkalibacter wakoensis JCM 9140 TaxID=1236970 RepID=W4PXZ6_9BACI|nr:permease [Halalkalibacter wakoensis]GAE24348.1 transporter [Halalkalibacter wakoensis JCM 9140]
MWAEFIQSFLFIALELLFLFVVISFVINLLQGYIPLEKIENQLNGSNKLLASMAAILFAFITPFCSCSTIPIVVTMLQKKLPFQIVMTFLFASPLLDPTILTIMGFVLGWKVTIMYSLITILFCLTIGFVLQFLGFKKYVKHIGVTGYEQKKSKVGFKAAWKEAFDLVRSVFPYVVIGAALGAVIHHAVPTEWVATLFGEDHWWLIPIAAIIGIPLYIRLSSMIPISQILILKGMALGPVMAMLISSAGASMPEVVLLQSIFKKELVGAFVLSVVSMSTVSGFIFYLL